jgi:hypothetical protein
MSTVKVITNIFYILGNIFVSLSTYETTDKAVYSDLHELVFSIFSHVFNLLTHERQINEEYSLRIEVT